MSADPELLRNLPAPGQCTTFRGAKICNHEHAMPHGRHAVTVDTWRQGRPGQHFRVAAPMPAAAPDATCTGGRDPDFPDNWHPGMNTGSCPTPTPPTGCGTGACSSTRFY